ncbi:hypothetical protein BD324DRAFT_499443 [Kockovaella imperatae]|uniref:protein-histidine N-methyltransferase n=1 Tax=Kockovaella imperatae TaxID=4999 RepID=A0A1Y1UEM3_9TREE|nr:hypothetical protein BD324DRAFT_499443 [Kockovaella imperatae]ORX36478.1 hypothetical protein BD324DRAFT_499443 [Kockovaella imperatae]
MQRSMTTQATEVAGMIIILPIDLGVLLSCHFRPLCHCFYLHSTFLEKKKSKTRVQDALYRTLDEFCGKAWTYGSMFKFNFELDEAEVDNEFGGTASSFLDGCPINVEAGPSRPRAVMPCHTVSLDQLLDRLPDKISYSPIAIPGSRSLLRRDLFDARFQLASEHNTAPHSDPVNGASTESDLPPEAGGENQGEGVIDVHSDLIPGFYEGGLKTWEGGVDLVEVLSEVKDIADWIRGSSILEVGCGTSLPTSFLLGRILSTPGSSSSRTTFRLQDYNLSVLSLVTLPNLLLAALPHIPPDSLLPAEQVEDVEQVLPDLDASGELVISPELKQGFKMLLQKCHVDLLFDYGAWSGLVENLKSAPQQRFDLILTSETIYSEDSVDDLMDVLRIGSTGTASREEHGDKQHTAVELADSIADLSVRDRWDLLPLREQSSAVILVGAKVLYFGVGGGLQAFLDAVKANGGWYETIKGWTAGVGRKVVRVGW